MQWTTGNVGTKSIHAIVENSLLELVGCYAWSPDKVGRDVGELCGIEPLGVHATDDIDALLALKPDCVVYNPMFANVDELVRILGAGINVVTTSEFITGHRLGDGRHRVAEACEQGGVDHLRHRPEPGLHPTLRDRDGRTLRPGRPDIHRGILRHHDLQLARNREDHGIRLPIDDPDLLAVTKDGSAIFREAVLIIADALGVELDDIRCEAEYAQTTEDLDLPGDWHIAKGCVAGIDVRWNGYIGERDVVEVRGVWTKGQTLEPMWEMGFGYHITVEGTADDQDHRWPSNRLRTFVAETIEDYILLGLTITAVPAITAIPAVIAAPPGIATYNDLPLLLPRGVLSV